MVDAVDIVDRIYIIYERIEIRGKYRLKLGIESPLFSTINEWLLNNKRSDNKCRIKLK